MSSNQTNPCEILRILLQSRPHCLSLLHKHAAILLPPRLVLLIFPTIVSSEAFLQLDMSDAQKLDQYSNQT